MQLCLAVLLAQQCDPKNRLPFRNPATFLCMAECGPKNLIDESYSCLSGCQAFQLQQTVRNEFFPKQTYEVVFCQENCPKYASVVGNECICQNDCDFYTYSNASQRFCTINSSCPPAFPIVNNSKKTCSICAQYVNQQGKCQPYVCGSKFYRTVQNTKFCVDACDDGEFKTQIQQQLFECVSRCATAVYNFDTRICQSSCSNIQVSDAQEQFYCANNCSQILHQDAERLICNGSCDAFIQRGNEQTLCVKQCVTKYFEAVVESGQEIYLCASKCPEESIKMYHILFGVEMVQCALDECPLKFLNESYFCIPNCDAMIDQSKNPNKEPNCVERCSSGYAFLDNSHYYCMDGCSADFPFLESGVDFNVCTKLCHSLMYDNLSLKCISECNGYLYLISDQYYCFDSCNSYSFVQQNGSKHFCVKQCEETFFFVNDQTDKICVAECSKYKLEFDENHFECISSCPTNYNGNELNVCEKQKSDRLVILVTVIVVSSSFSYQYYCSRNFIKKEKAKKETDWSLYSGQEKI